MILALTLSPRADARTADEALDFLHDAYGLQLERDDHAQLTLGGKSLLILDIRSGSRRIDNDARRDLLRHLGANVEAAS